MWFSEGKAPWGKRAIDPLWTENNSCKHPTVQGCERLQETRSENIFFDLEHQEILALTGMGCGTRHSKSFDSRRRTRSSEPRDWSSHCWPPSQVSGQSVSTRLASRTSSIRKLKVLIEDERCAQKRAFSSVQAPSSTADREQLPVLLLA